MPFWIPFIIGGVAVWAIRESAEPDASQIPRIELQPSNITGLSPLGVGTLMVGTAAAAYFVAKKL